MDFTYRIATEADKDFIIKTIVEAEKGAFDIISYCAIFSISENEFEDLLGKILDEDIEGQEICYSNFIIVEGDGEIAGAMGMFIENKDGPSSNLIKMNMLMHFLGRDKIISAGPLLSVMNDVNIDRQKDTLQIEYVYIEKKFSGYGLIWLLIDEHIRLKKSHSLLKDKIQIILPENRTVSILYYERYGFEMSCRKQSVNKEIVKLISCDSKILLEMNLL